VNTASFNQPLRRKVHVVGQAVNHHAQEFSRRVNAGRRRQVRRRKQHALRRKASRHRESPTQVVRSNASRAVACINAGNQRLPDIHHERRRTVSQRRTSGKGTTAFHEHCQNAVMSSEWV